MFLGKNEKTKNGETFSLELVGVKKFREVQKSVGNLG
jgi:hypothetical protein